MQKKCQTPINKLAGGALTSDIDDVINNLIKIASGEVNARSGESNIHQAIKSRALESLVAGKWRRSLRDSMCAAGEIMDIIADGLPAATGSRVVVDFLAYLRGKGLVGTGSGLLHAVLEVGLTMDPLLGLPYYPGSSVKGAVRSVAESLFNRDDYVDLLFGEAGDSGHAGVYVFTSAYPVGCYKDSPHPCLVITGDVVTPHYFVPGEGVVKREMDARPVPIQHVAIAPGTVFRFIIGVRPPPIRLRDKTRDLLEYAKSEGVPVSAPDGGSGMLVELGKLGLALTLAALNWGIAARSGKGYNFFAPLQYESKLHFEVASFVFKDGCHARGREEQTKGGPGGPRRGGGRGYRGRR